MPYAYITSAEANASLSARLADPANIRFLYAEVDLCIAEAMRTFSALSGLWQDQPTPVLIPAGTLFADLPTIFPQQRAYTLTVRDLIGAIQYSLIEPYSPAAWAGTEMFTLPELVAAIQRRRDQFLLETGCRLTRHAPIPDAPGLIDPESGGNYLLDTSIIDIRRAAWTDALSGKTSPLWPSTNASLVGASPLWPFEPALPRTYGFNQRAPSTIQFGPPPAASGSLDLLTIDAGAELDPLAAPSGTLLDIPDDFAPFVAWGARADLLSKDGPARDYARALYCERRYQLGVAAARSWSTPIVDARINGRPLQFSSLAGIDQARVNWQNRLGTTTVIAPAGLNLVAFADPPAAAFSLSATIIRNAPVPATPTDQLQIPREYFDLLEGYAEHIAMFKVGGQEFVATTQLADAMFVAAAGYNDRLVATGVFEAEPRVSDGTVRGNGPSARGVRRRSGSTTADPSAGGGPQTGDPR